MSTILERIRAKVARAKKHLAEFDAGLDAFHKTSPYRVDFKEDPNSRNRTYYVAKADRVPAALECIAADALTNLRSPLDHIAHQAVLQAIGGTKPKGTVFYYPICATANDYKSARTKVEAIRNDILEAIDRTEPYEGGKGHALWQLNNLNRHDKHELLVGAGSAAMVNILPVEFFQSLGATPTFGVFVGGNSEVVHQGDVLPYRDTLDFQPKDQSDFSFHVTFADVRVSKCEPSTKTLHDIANLVSEIVETIGVKL